MVLEGQQITVKIDFLSKTPGRFNFTFGTTIRHIITGQDFDLPLIQKEEDFQEQGTATFFWTIPPEAPKGSYSVISAIWEGESNGIPFTRLDDEVAPNAFIIN